MSRVRDLEDCLRALIDFAKCPEIQNAIDGACDPTMYIEWGKELLESRDVADKLLGEGDRYAMLA